MRMRYNNTGFISFRKSVHIYGQLINHIRYNDVESIRDVYISLKRTPHNNTIFVNIAHNRNNRKASDNTLRISSGNAEGKPNAIKLKAMQMDMTKRINSSMRELIPINFPMIISIL
jgi:hypothetical protein